MSETASNISPQLAQGIAYFEQMLLVMPDDRQALEFLCVAYEQAGENDKRRQALVSLAGVLLKEGDLDSAERIGERLAGLEAADAQEMLQKIELARHPERAAAAQPASAEPVPLPASPSSPAVPPPSSAGDEGALRQAAIKAEVNLVQTLAQARILDEAATSFALQRLTEYANAPGLFLISALAILEKENSPLGEAAAAHVADTAGTPPVPIDAFNLKADLLKLLPPHIVRLRGVLPFARLQDAVLIALANPLDTPLRREIETLVGGPCLFYLAPPHGLDELLEKLLPENEAAPAAEGG